jgi:hypothetical protein
MLIFTILLEVAVKENIGIIYTVMDVTDKLKFRVLYRKKKFFQIKHENGIYPSHPSRISKYLY